MSYPRGADVGVAGTGGGSIGSASLVATLGTYVTSNSLSIALLNYPSSNSVSAMIVTGVGDRPTSNSVSAMIVTGIGDRPTSNSVSAMIVTGIGDRPTSNSISIQITSRLTTYMTSGSLLTALSPYITSASVLTALSPYITSASVGTALTPYLTSASAASAYIISNSVSIMIAAVALSSNSASAMIVAQINAVTLDRLADVVLTAPSLGQVLKFNGTNWVNDTDATSGGGSTTFTGDALIIANTVSFSATVHITTGINALGNSRVSGTLSVGAFQINGRPAGAVMLASASGATQAGNGAMNFSGSWSDIGVFIIQCGWRQLGNSGTMSVNVYTDGGTTPFLSIAALNTASATTNIAQIKVFGGGGAWYLAIEYINNTNAIKIHATSTLNTGIVNCIRVGIANVTATASNIAAFLTGFRKA
jgi:hypothetical protein